MIGKLYLALALALPALIAAPVAVETVSFPGGSLELLDGNKFVWESEDVSGLLPSNVRRAVEIKIQTPLNSSLPNIAALVEVYTNDGRYELIPLSHGALDALRLALAHQAGN